MTTLEQAMKDVLSDKEGCLNGTCHIKRPKGQTLNGPCSCEKTIILCFKQLQHRVYKEENKKPVECGACSGSGRYDSHGAPPCSACNGTGMEQC